MVALSQGNYDPVKDTVWAQMCDRRSHWQTWTGFSGSADWSVVTEVVSNASCTTNGMASVCKVLDDSFGVQ